MYFNELPMEKIKEIFLSNNALQCEFYEHMLRIALDNCRDKLSEFSCLDWQLNSYRDVDYVRLNDETYNRAWTFICELKDYSKCYGLSTRLEKKLEMVKNLGGTNLFMHHAKILVEMFYEDEIKSEMDYANGALFLNEDTWIDYQDDIEICLDGSDLEWDEDEECVCSTTTTYYR